MKSSKNNDDELLSEINVTPLVDVMLVLLIIFMISAPLMFSGVHLKLPKTAKNKSVKLTKNKVIISINDSAKIFLGKTLVPLDKFKEMIKQEVGSLETDIVYVRADKKVNYEIVAKVITLLKVTGVKNISLVTEYEK